MPFDGDREIGRGENLCNSPHGPRGRWLQECLPRRKEDAVVDFDGYAAAGFDHAHLTLFDQGILNGTHIAILAPAIYLMGSQVQYMGRILGCIGTEGRYIPIMVAISVLNAFGAMLVMNILL